MQNNCHQETTGLDTKWSAIAGECETASRPLTSGASGSTASYEYARYLIFGICASLYLFPFMRIFLQGTDEGTLLYGAQRVAQGQVFGRDFFEVIGPGSFYWLAIFFKIFGITFIASRICLFLTSLATGVLIYFLSRELCQVYPLLPCLIMTGTSFGMLWPTTSHHIDSNFLALMSVACMVLWARNHCAAWLIAGGVSCGMLSIFHLPKGLLLVTSILLWLWTQWRTGARSCAFVIVAGSYCGVVGAAVLGLWTHGALWATVYANIVWPSSHYGSWNNVRYAHGLVIYYWNVWVTPNAGFRWTFPLACALIVPFVFVAVLPFLLLPLGFLRRRTSAGSMITLYWLCGWAIWISEFHRKDMFHLVFGSPLLIILAVFYLEAYRSKQAALTVQGLIVSSVALVGFNLILAFTAHATPTRVGNIAVFRDDPALTFLQSHVAPGTEIFAYPYCPSYYFLSATVNPTPYSILLYGYNTSSQFDEVIRTLDQRRVKYVIWHTTFFGNGGSTISTRLAPPSTLVMEPYLLKKYRIVRDYDGLRIMERREFGNED